jgi:hypothetical protein
MKNEELKIKNAKRNDSKAFSNFKFLKTNYIQVLYKKTKLNGTFYTAFFVSIKRQSCFYFTIHLIFNCYGNRFYPQARRIF